MVKLKTVGLSYGALRKECLEAVRQWPGCETIGGIQIIRSSAPGGFSVRVTLYGKTDERLPDRLNNWGERHHAIPRAALEQKAVASVELPSFELFG